MSCLPYQHHAREEESRAIFLRIYSEVADPECIRGLSYKVSIKERKKEKKEREVVNHE